MKKNKPSRGGSRPGSGRKLKGDSKRTITMRVTPDEKKVIEQMRGEN